MAKQKKKKEEKEDHSGLFIPAGIFVGMGFGFLFNQLVAGLFIGMGFGFLLMALFRLFRK